MTLTLDFQPAIQEKSHLRADYAGVPGSGKTFTSLKTAGFMMGGKWTETQKGETKPSSSLSLPLRANGRAQVAFIDTERGTARKYSSIFPAEGQPSRGFFDVLEMPRNNGVVNPQDFLDAIAMARRADYPFLIIDSASHVWEGILAMKEALDASKKQSGGYTNEFANWKDVNPFYLAYVEAVFTYPGHVICCTRMEIDRVQEKDERGKTVVRNIGMRETQRKGTSYEFDLVLEFESAVATVTKTRCQELPEGRTFTKPGAELANILTDWLQTGVEPVALPMNRQQFVDAAYEIGYKTQEEIAEALRVRGLLNTLGDNRFEKMLEGLKVPHGAEEAPGQEQAPAKPAKKPETKAEPTLAELAIAAALNAPAD